MKEKLIFITNDDGIQALGIRTLAHLMSRLGRVIVVAPDSARSGAGCSISPAKPVELKKWADFGTCDSDPLLPQKGEHDIAYYTCSGTPVDCVKIAGEQVLEGIAPDLMVSGINHGDNASVSVHYSGTVGAAIEGTLKGWPSVAYSFQAFIARPDFTPFYESIVKVAEHVLAHGIPKNELLNVNLPDVEKIQGTRVCRMAKGEWSGEWVPAHNPYGKNLFWLSGVFKNGEPEQTGTDCWALSLGYIAITPIQLDMTAYESLEMLKKYFNS